MRVITITLLLAAALPAQGNYYAFDERAPRTKLEQTIDKALPCVVKVHGASGLRTIEAYSTGVLVSAEGHVLTIDLVMIQKDKTKVVLPNGRVLQAEVLDADDRLGVRLLKVDAGEPLPFLSLSTRDDLKNGSLVVSLGNCFRLAEFSEKVSATFGVLTARAKTGLRYRLAEIDYDGELLLTDATNNPGHEGGALLTVNGEWIGMNAKIVESVETNTQLSAAIPAAELRAFLARVLAKKSAPVASPVADKKKVFHGIALFEKGGHTSPPAYVERVAPDSPGAALGLLPDDLIVRVDDNAVRSCKEFRQLVEKHAPGEEVLITFKRGSEIKRAKLKLVEAKQ